MEEIEKILEEIIIKELQRCRENKTVPSKEVLDTVSTLHQIMYGA